MVFPINTNGKSDNPYMPCIFGACNVLGYTSSDSWKAGSPAIIKIHTHFVSEKSEYEKHHRFLHQW